MDADPSVCMFCQDGLSGSQAENVAFIAHIETKAECQDAFSAWTHHMQTDWLGD